MKTDSLDKRISLDYDPETGTYSARFDSTNVAPSIAIVEVLAEICETDSTELPPLADVIDPEALDLICTPRPDGRRDGDRVVEFAYLDRAVRVTSYGVVAVESLP